MILHLSISTLLLSPIIAVLSLSTPPPLLPYPVWLAPALSQVQDIQGRDAHTHKHTHTRTHRENRRSTLLAFFFFFQVVTTDPWYRLLPTNRFESGTRKRGGVWIHSFDVRRYFFRCSSTSTRVRMAQKYAYLFCHG